MDVSAIDQPQVIDSHKFYDMSITRQVKWITVKVSIPVMQILDIDLFGLLILDEPDGYLTWSDVIIDEGA